MRHIRRLPLLIMLLFSLSACSAGRSAFNKGEKLERDGKLDEAVFKYAEASTANPDIGEYRIRYMKAVEAASREHLKKADDFLSRKQYDEALREYESAYAMDSSLARAKQQAEEVVRLRNAQVFYREGVELEKNRKNREALTSYQKAVGLSPDLKEAKEAAERLIATKRPKMDGYELNLKSTKPITLKFKDAKIKDVFNILSQLSGINFIFDEGLKDSNVTVYLENATFQQALEIISGLHKLGKKVLNENTIILYPRNPEKLKQYEELLLETFYLNKLDAKKAVNLIRTMLQVRKIYVNEEMNALVIRDTPDVIEVARKILEANDVPDAEVVLEVEVVEIAKSNEEKFGLALSTYAVQAATWPPGSATPFADTLAGTTTTTTPATGSTGTTTTTTTASPNNLLNIFRINGFNTFMTVPSATFNFGKTLANGETLANPKIRVKNREKAKFNVGQRVPITTTTTSGTTVGYSVNVQYVDVGVKLNAEPVIQLSNDISIKLSMEVSSILSQQKVGSDQATTVVTIGTRNLDTVLNLRDGETSIIGGLIQNSATKSKQKIMLLGDLPLIGPLLSSNNDKTDKSELILAITPRIVRAVTIPEGDVTSFWSGKEDEPTIGKLYTSFTEPETVVSAEPAAVAPSVAAPAGKPALPQAPVKAGAVPEPPTASEPVIPPVVAPATKLAMPVAASSAPAEILPAGSPAAAPSATPAPPTAAPVALPAPPAVPAAKVTGTPPVNPAGNGPEPGAGPAAGWVRPGAEVTGAAATPPGTPPATTTAATQVPKTPSPPAKVAVKLLGPATTKVNEQFTIDVRANDVTNLYVAPFTITFDPQVVEFVGATEGSLLKQDGKPTSFHVNVDRKAGRVSINLGRVGNVGGVAGSGSLAIATFRGKKSGEAPFAFAGIRLLSAVGQQFEALPGGLTVEVK